jgi:hypothetical protein
MKSNAELKLERLAHANELIRIISSHGRSFFFNKTHDRIAELVLCSRGRIWFLDDYTGKLVYTHKTTWTNKWRGFSHGGTLRDLVEMMRDYIVHGWPIYENYLGPDNIFTDGNIWGYTQEAIDAVRAEAILLPIINAAVKVGQHTQGERE